MKQNKHSILIQGSPGDILFEIIRWGEAPWWPKNSLMRFVRLDSGAVQNGTRYRQKVLLPFAPSWEAVVSAITSESITRKFANGMFEGSETISLKRTPQGHHVDYEMNYRIHGFFNRILWNSIFEKLHNANIEAILLSLKGFLEKRSSE